MERIGVVLREHRVLSLVVLLAFFGGAVFGVNRLLALPLPDGCDFHTASQFAGSRDGFAERMGDECLTQIDVGSLRASLALDLIYLTYYGVGMHLLLRWWWPAWRDGPVRRAGRWLIWVPIMAAGLDVLENIVTAFAFTDAGAHLAYRSDGWAVAVEEIALPKWFLAVAVSAVSTLIVGVRVVLGPHRPDESAA